MTPTARSAAMPAGRQTGSRLTFSVVICAYTGDRWATLAAAHDAVVEQLGADDDLVIVIDHNEALYTRAATAFGAERVIRNEGAPGLSAARNAGVTHSGGAAIVFLDDDAVPDPGWLERVRETFGGSTSVLVVGTEVAPAWSGGRAPRWFPEEFGWVVGCSYRGLPTALTPVRNPIGAAMAIHRSAFDLVGGFRGDLGRVAALPAGCEETEFCIRLGLAAPEAGILYEPAAAVRHLVPEQRQTLRYFLRRCFHEGRSKWHVTRLSSTACLSAERRYLRRVLPLAVVRGVAGGLRGEVSGVQRALAVVAGLTMTTLGFTAAGMTWCVPRSARRRRAVRLEKTGAHV